VYCFIPLLLLLFITFFLFGFVFIPVFLIIFFASVDLAAYLTGQYVVDMRRQGLVCFILLPLVVLVVVVVVVAVVVITANIF